MKKLISLALALVFILSMATVAFAVDNPDADPDALTGVTPASITINKRYVVDADANTLENAATFPEGDVLKFDVTPADNNPDDVDITVADADDGHIVDANPDAITITFSEYTKVGVYTYTITEQAQTNTQGVTNDSNSEIVVKVLIAYNTDHTALTSKVVIGQGTGNGTDTNGKVDTLLNEYGLGSLNVSKTVSGNLAGQSEEFEITVTFSTEKDKVVRSAITYGNETIEPSAWKDDDGDGVSTAEVTIKLTHGSNITFTNIPVGVSYTVVEKDYTKGDKNDALSGYEVAKYTVGGQTTQTANGVSGVISDNGESDSVAIENAKSTDIATGITLDTLPFVLILAVCAGAVVLFVVKRRHSAEF